MSIPPQQQSNIRLGIQIVFALCMGIGAWYAKGVGDKQDELAKAIHGIQLENAANFSNRFTSDNWRTASEKLAERFTEHDKRFNTHDLKLSEYSNEVKVLGSKVDEVGKKLDQIISYHKTQSAGE